MKLYIAGPMTGLPNFNYPAFERAETLLNQLGFETESPHHNGENGEQERFAYEEFIRMGLKQLLQCNGVALLDGWERSRGVAIELYVARAIKIPCNPVERWVGDELMPKHRRDKDES